MPFSAAGILAEAKYMHWPKADQHSWHAAMRLPSMLSIEFTMCALAAATAAADRARHAAVERIAGNTSSGPVELDEFGRDAGLMKRQEQQHRAARRHERLATRTAVLQRSQVGTGWLMIRHSTPTDGSHNWHARCMHINSMYAKCRF